MAHDDRVMSLWLADLGRQLAHRQRPPQSGTRRPPANAAPRENTAARDRRAGPAAGGQGPAGSRRGVGGGERRGAAETGCGAAKSGGGRNKVGATIELIHLIVAGRCRQRGRCEFN